MRPVPEPSHKNPSSVWARASTAAGAPSRTVQAVVVELRERLTRLLGRRRGRRSGGGEEGDQHRSERPRGHGRQIYSPAAFALPTSYWVWGFHVARLIIIRMTGASTIRILAADDHPLIRAGLVSFLATEPGLEVVAEAGNGEEALEKYRDYGPTSC